MEGDAGQIGSGTANWRTTSIASEGTRRTIHTSSGFLDEETADRSSGIVGSAFIRDGRIFSSRANTCAPDQRAPTRATLREGDLAIVLVRRVGESAVVTAEHAGWTASRSIGIVRAEPDIVRWLRIWLQTPTARARIDEDVTAHIEPTISLDTLRSMLFPLPPPDVVNAYHRAFSLIEELSSLYREAARTAVALADALHDDWATSNAPWETRPLAKVAKPKTGKGSERSLSSSPEAAADVIAPRDLYDLPVPHVARFRLSGPAVGSTVHPPGTVVLSTRSDGMHMAVLHRPATPLRSVAAVRPVEEEDVWWLLHELRSRSAAITELAQGQNRREISALALKGLQITWPDRSTRADFHKAAGPLHAAAQLLVSKVATLHDLRDALLRDISSKAGVLREPATEPEDQVCSAPLHGETDASRGPGTSGPSASRTPTPSVAPSLNAAASSPFPTGSSHLHNSDARHPTSYPPR